MMETRLFLDRTSIHGYYRSELDRIVEFNRSRLDRVQVRFKIGSKSGVTRHEPSEIPNFILSILNTARLFCYNTRRDIYYIELHRLRFPNGYWLPTFRIRPFLAVRNPIVSGERGIFISRHAEQQCRRWKNFILFIWMEFIRGAIVASSGMLLFIFRLLRSYLPTYASKSPQGYSGLSSIKKKGRLSSEGIDSLKETIN